MAIPIPDNERERLEALRRYEILDTSPEDCFDRITRTLAAYLQVPVALISLVDEDRQWFKSRYGLGAEQTERNVAFCAHAIMGHQPLVIGNATADERFKDNPLVTGDPRIRFYAGAPLATHDGLNLGTLCAIDSEPRTLTEEQQHVLADLAQLVIDQLELRLAARTASREIEAREARTRAIVQTALDGIIAIDEKGLIDTFNRAAERIFGYLAAEVIGRNVSVLMPEPHRSDHDHYVSSYLATGEAKIIGIGREVTGLRSDGTAFPMDLRISEMQVAGRRMFTGVVRDVTEQRRIQKALERSEQEARDILRNLTDAFYRAGTDGRFTMVSRSAAELFGYPESELIGMQVASLYVEPSARGKFLQAVEDNDGEIRDYEISLRRPGGNVLWASVSAHYTYEDGERTGIEGTLRDITERKNLERLKREFVSTVSHELRTPLTSIKGALGLIRGGVTGELPDRMKSMLNIAYHNSDRLVRLINDILDIEKIEAGRMSFRMRPLELTALVSQSLEANKGYADAHAVSFVLRQEVAQATVQGDEDRLMQVLANLLSNAAKFSPDGEAVEVCVSTRGAGYRVAVSDRGPGIPGEFQPKVFEKFAQADSSDSREKGGTGLGLSICKAIIETHGGTIDFQSHIGNGTTFYFDLPERIDEEPGLARPLAANGGTRVLICEDDRDVAMLMRMIIEQDGFATDVAHDALQAERMLAQSDYAVLALDLSLPGKDGLSLIRQLRDAPRTRDLPIVVVSAKASDTEREISGNSLNVVDWIQKPIDERRLLSALRSVSSSARNAKARILHVEDDADIRAIVSSLVADRATVVPAASLAEAEAVLAQSTFELVILDLDLPDAHGEELFPALNRAGQAASPVIVFSASETSPRLAKRIHQALVKSRASNQDLLRAIRAAIGAN